jgi:hypothetical protein
MKGNKKPRMMEKSDGKKRQSNNEGENHEDCAADQCLKVFLKIVCFRSEELMFLFLT